MPSRRFFDGAQSEILSIPLEENSRLSIDFSAKTDLTATVNLIIVVNLNKNLMLMGIGG
jgi:hypothetical protein